MAEKKRKEQKLVKAIIVLLRHTTWRCGRSERLIVKHLYNRLTLFGKPETKVDDLLENLKLTGKKRNEFLDAIRRLERRNIIRISSIVG